MMNSWTVLAVPFEAAVSREPFWACALSSSTAYSRCSAAHWRWPRLLLDALSLPCASKGLQLSQSLSHCSALFLSLLPLAAGTHGSKHSCLCHSLWHRVCGTYREFLCLSWVRRAGVGGHPVVGKTGRGPRPGPDPCWTLWTAYLCMKSMHLPWSAISLPMMFVVEHANTKI